MVSRRRWLSIVVLSTAAVAFGRARALTAQRPTDPRDRPPVLTAFSINGSADTVVATAPFVTLVHATVGTPPSEYRISHRADFVGASWTAYEPTPAIRDWYDSSGEACDAGAAGTGGGHRVTFYFQVRAIIGEEVRIVGGQRQLQPARAESNVLRATICARSASAPRP